MAVFRDKHDLLGDQLQRISKERNLSSRGFHFERFLGELFKDAHIEYEPPFRTPTDQIDGRIKFGDRDFIIEARWTKNRITKNDIAVFRDKMSRVHAHGLFISWSGFEGNIPVNGDRDNKLLLMTGAEIKRLLRRQLSLWELIDYKIARWHTIAFLPQKLTKRHKKRWSSLLSHLQEAIAREIGSLRSKYNPALYVERSIESEMYEFLRDTSLKNLFFIIEKAGSGKTNLVCNLAERISQKEYPTIFFNASNYLIDDDLESTLHNLYRTSGDIIQSSASHDFFSKLEYLSRSHNKPVVVIIDGINENRNYEAMKKSLLGLAYNNLRKRVKIIVTCRDIYWEFFETPEWEQFRYFESKNRLFYFNDFEFEEAQRRYFIEYDIEKISPIIVMLVHLRNVESAGTHTYGCWHFSFLPENRHSL